MLFFNKKEKQVEEMLIEGKVYNGSSDGFKQRFFRNHLAKASLRVLFFLMFVAVFADFIANEKPIYCKIGGKSYFPICKQYLIDLGIAKLDARFFQNDWDEHEYDAVIFPPIPYSPKTIDSKNRGYVSPFEKQNVASIRYRHWFGTDKIGHDVAAGMISGTRVALLVGVIAMSIASLIGILLGAIAGFFGDNKLKTGWVSILIYLFSLLLGWFYGFHVRSFQLAEAANGSGLVGQLLLSILIIGLALFIGHLLVLFFRKIGWKSKSILLPLDLIIMRLIEVINSIPGFLLLLSIVGVLQKGSIFIVMAIIGLIRWTGIARFLRAELLRIRNLDYIEAARAMGFSNKRILFKHALPNALTPVLITISFGIASAILLEAALSFLGFGAGEDTVTWGRLLAESRKYPAGWWLALFPGVAIFITVTIFNLIGEGLSKAISAE